MKVGILTVSDKGAKGEREDRSGPAIREIMDAAGGEIVRSQVVPDERWYGFQPAGPDPRSDQGRDRAGGSRDQRSHPAGGDEEDADGDAQPGGRGYPEVNPDHQPPRKREGRSGKPRSHHSSASARHRDPQGDRQRVRQTK
jgi:hypothetical protein